MLLPLQCHHLANAQAERQVVGPKLSVIAKDVQSR